MCCLAAHHTAHLFVLKGGDLFLHKNHVEGASPEEEECTQLQQTAIKYEERENLEEIKINTSLSFKPTSQTDIQTNSFIGHQLTHSGIHPLLHLWVTITISIRNCYFHPL